MYSCILTISAPNVNLNFYRFSPLLARKSDDPLSLFLFDFYRIIDELLSNLFSIFPV